MTDRVLSLLHAGHRGSITALSRRGLLPQVHKPAGILKLDAADIPFGAGLGYLMRWLRSLAKDHEARGGDWRGVIDGLRPHTQVLWRSLPLEARRRFLRHGRTWWDIHRHRMAPLAAARIDEARRRGQLTVIGGRVVGFEPAGEKVAIRYLARGDGKERHLPVDAVYECRGRATNVEETDNPVLRQLLAAGAARPDALGLGLDVGEDCAVTGRDGARSARIRAVGPITSGTFWEIVAVPDIRRQVAMLADRLLDRG